MKWRIKDKETVVKTCFAILPKRIGDYRVWLSRYYKTWDYFYQGVYSGHIPHWFVFREEALKYVENKLNSRRHEDEMESKRKGHL